jgi:hypothetical protein
MKLNILNNRIFWVGYRFSNDMAGFFMLRYNAAYFDKPFDEARAIAEHFCKKLDLDVKQLSVRLANPLLANIQTTLSYEKVVAQKQENVECKMKLKYS